jgi:isopentenyl diphosphate isomerase/L-lactate dehydrogenase-like FMN-dependent dehydrogenase
MIPTGMCHQCDDCRGLGCVGEIPGMGGAFDNAIFQLNCAAWPAYAAGNGEVAKIRLAPITGAVQNLGCIEEKDFYAPMIAACIEAGIGLCIGDGFPDVKILLGIGALRRAGKKGAVFIKPYSNERILERMSWCEDVAEVVGVDIDSYRIATMSGVTTLFRKKAGDLAEIKKRARVPFAVKGILRDEDVALVRELRPDIAVISNHGGRVETARRSTAEFLAARGRELRRYAGELWVDGGIRRLADTVVARQLGASEVLIGRPLVSAFLREGEEGVVKTISSRFRTRKEDSR